MGCSEQLPSKNLERFHIISLWNMTANIRGLTRKPPVPCTYFRHKIPRYTGIRPHGLGVTCLRPWTCFWPHGSNSYLFETIWGRRQTKFGNQPCMMVQIVQRFGARKTFLPGKDMRLPELVENLFFRLLVRLSRQALHEYLDDSSKKLEKLNRNVILTEQKTRRPQGRR